MSKYYTLPTAEPFFIPGGRTGCLLVHGFTGTPKEMRMLGDSLATAGYTVLAPRLFAHAANAADMKRARWQDWLASVEDGLNLLKGCTDHQFVMGLSMGGILSMIAAARFDIDGVVSFSTPFDLPANSLERVFLFLLGWLNLHFGKGKPDWRNLEAARNHVEYPYYPTRAVIELKRLINVMRRELKGIQIPALFVQSKGDAGIQANSMDYLYDHISSVDKTKMWVENSGHVVVREPEREKIFLAVKSFVERITKTK